MRCLLVFLILMSNWQAHGEPLSMAEWRALMDKSGANRAGVCPNGVYINPARNISCDSVRTPPPAVMKQLKIDVGGQTCDLNELISVKQTINYILDQFYCSQRGAHAALCAAGVGLPVYAGLRMAAGSEVNNLVIAKEDSKIIAQKVQNEIAQSQAKYLAEGNMHDFHMEKVLTAERGAILKELESIEGTLAKKSATRVVANKLAEKTLAAATGAGTLLLMADLIDLSMSNAGAPTLTDKYKTLEGFIEFAKMSDQDKCKYLSLPGNDLHKHFVSMSVMLQRKLTEDLPTETTIQCGPTEGTTLAVFKNKDGTSSMRGYEFDSSGEIKSMSGYPLAFPSDPADGLNFKQAMKISTTGREGFKQKTFFISFFHGEANFYSEPPSLRSVGEDTPIWTDRDKKVLAESRRMALMAPAIYQFCARRPSSPSIPSQKRTSPDGTL